MERTAPSLTGRGFARPRNLSPRSSEALVLSRADRRRASLSWAPTSASRCPVARCGAPRPLQGPGAR